MSTICGGLKRAKWGNRGKGKDWQQPEHRLTTRRFSVCGQAPCLDRHVASSMQSTSGKMMDQAVMALQTVPAAERRPDGVGVPAAELGRSEDNRSVRMYKYISYGRRFAIIVFDYFRSFQSFEVFSRSCLHDYQSQREASSSLLDQTTISHTIIRYSVALSSSSQSLQLLKECLHFGQNVQTFAAVPSPSPQARPARLVLS